MHLEGFNLNMRLSGVVIVTLLLMLVIMYIIDVWFKTVWVYETIQIKPRGIYLHDPTDTNYSRFDVGWIKLKFLPRFKNPCFIEATRYVGGDNEGNSVYNFNSFETSSNYPREIAFRRGMKKLLQDYPNGVVVPMDLNINVCNELQQNNSFLPEQSQRICRIRCLPYFHVLGMAKSGTTDLFNRLQFHPYIRGGNIKELFWWSQYRVHILNATLSDYIDQFDGSVATLLKQKTVDLNSGQSQYPMILGDFTPVTFSDDPLWFEDGRNMDKLEPQILKIHDMYDLNPNLRLIVMLRNPTTRFYSAYNMFRGRGGSASPEDFHLRVESTIRWWRNCTRVLPIRACAYGSPGSYQGPVLQLNNNRFPGEPMVPSPSGEIRKCLYSIFANDWLSVFPRKNLLFIKTEEYSINTSGIINGQIFPFLDLPRLPESEFDFKRDKRFNQRVYKPMKYVTKVLLDQFFLPFNRQLASLLNDTKWIWA